MAVLYWLSVNLIFLAGVFVSDPPVWAWCQLGFSHGAKGEFLREDGGGSLAAPVFASGPDAALGLLPSRALSSGQALSV